MRVGLLTTSYPRHAGDSAGSFVRGFAQALRRCGHEVDVLAPADGHVRAPFDATPVRYMPPSWERTFYGAGVPDNVRHPSAWPGLLTFPLALARTALRRSADWDAVVSHFGLPCAAVGRWVCAQRRKRGSALRHLAVWHSADVTWAARLRLPVDGWADHHWCVTEHARQRLRLEKATVAPMGAEVRSYEREESRRRLGFDGRPVVAIVARLVPIKGIHHAIHAVAGTGMVLAIAGEGPEREGLQRLAEKRGVPALFLGAIEEETRDRLLSAADVFCLPSVPIGGRTEGAPLAVLEAQLAALPVIASRTGGVAERVRDGVDGRLVPPGDEDALRRALMSFQAGGMAGFGERGRQHAQRYRWTTLAPQIERMLQRPDG